MSTAVKELVENSLGKKGDMYLWIPHNGGFELLDAGAKMIDIKLYEYGSEAFEVKHESLLLLLLLV